ncbi:MAG: DNA mismatch repair endonuclease MutL [Desulfitobacterium sp.]|nr:DNA mismatch repair endonuclease MutL [Desulfitobacterium sp.]
MTRNIQILDIQAANQIAAGEVVERPVSVVKELIENSLDAGATKIEVVVEGSGVELIRVQDNGVGIPAQELPISLQRHATSKIRSIEDLNTLGTLGFRGEALPSIASVSKMEILTRPQKEISGAHLIFEGGKEIEFLETGCPPGTTVIVKDLFYNTPARRKFLKSKNREFGLISECIGKLALARPDVAFTLRHPKTIVLQTPGRGQLIDSVGAVLGHNTARRLLEISYQKGDWELTGFISPPDLVRSSRQSEYLIVNGRIIRSSVISRGILEGYHTLIPNKYYPITVLKLKMPPNQYDVNVHPTKMEIRFHEEKKLSEFIAEGIRQVLMASHPITPFSKESPHRESLAREANFTSKKINSQKKMNYSKEVGFSWGLAGIKAQEPQDINRTLEPNDSLITQDSIELPILQKSNLVHTPQESKLDSKPIENGSHLLVFEGNPVQITPETNTVQIPKDTNLANRIQENSSPEADNLNPQEYVSIIQEEDIEYNPLLRLCPIGQIFQTYILATDEENLVVIDQHAAHERINYEKLFQEHQKKPGDSQMLLIPTPIELSPGEEEALLEYILVLNEMGFILEHFGTRTYLLRGIPAYSGPYAGETLLREFLDHVLTNQIPPRMEELLEEWIYLLACKDSIKAKDNLNPLEMEQLIFQLSKTNNPYTCPHGRPTMIQLSKKEFERRFYRS